MKVRHPWIWKPSGRRDAAAVQLPLARDAGGIWRSDWTPLLEVLKDDHLGPAVRAATFHASLARTLCEQALAVRRHSGVSRVGFCGGVFRIAP